MRAPVYFVTTLFFDPRPLFILLSYFATFKPFDAIDLRKNTIYTGHADFTTPTEMSLEVKSMHSYLFGLCLH